tara:strand:+ start:2400 stop:2738 length:339 start_codon:yes stop_codon:yes gene_type:complete
MINNMFKRVSRLSATVLEQFGKAAEMQMKAFQCYSDIALKPVMKASEVRDVDSLKNLTSVQSETLKSLNEQFTADMKAWWNYFNEAREQVQKAISGAGEPATQKGKVGAQKS